MENPAGKTVTIRIRVGLGILDWNQVRVRVFFHRIPSSEFFFLMCRKNTFLEINLPEKCSSGKKVSVFVFLGLVLYLGIF